MTTPALETGARAPLLDVLRGFALCGILLINIPLMGRSALVLGPPPSAPNLEDAEWQAYVVSQLFVEGTMRGLFTLLFGASFLLLMRQAEARGGEGEALRLHYQRAVGLVLLGLFHAFGLLWFGDILFLYGLTALLLFPLRRWPARDLLRAGLAGVTLLTALGAINFMGALPAYRLGAAAEARLAAGEPLTAAEETARAAYAAALADRYPPPEDFAAEAAARLGSYADTWRWHAAEWLSYHQPDWLFYSLLESLSFMALGMALFRFGVLTGDAPPGLALALAIGGFGFGVGLSALELALAWPRGFDPDALTLNDATYQLSRLAGTLGWVGVLALVFGRERPRRLVGRALEAMGRLALTNYLAASAICAVLFYGFGLRLFGAFSTLQLWGVAAAILGAQAAFSLWWRARGLKAGPAERVLRAIAHWRLTPFRLGGSRNEGARHGRPREDL